MQKVGRPHLYITANNWPPQTPEVFAQMDLSACHSEPMCWEALQILSFLQKNQPSYLVPFPLSLSQKSSSVYLRYFWSLLVFLVWEVCRDRQTWQSTLERQHCELFPSPLGRDHSRKWSPVHRASPWSSTQRLNYKPHSNQWQRTKDRGLTGKSLPPLSALCETECEGLLKFCRSNKP